MTNEASAKLKAAALRINKLAPQILAIQKVLLGRYNTIAPKLTKYDAVIDRMATKDAQGNYVRKDEQGKYISDDQQQRLKNMITSSSELFTQIARIDTLLT